MTPAHSATPRRYLALWFPFLSADRWPQMPGREVCAAPAKPRVLTERHGNALRIGAVDAAAQKLGLRPGLPLADARARFAGLDVAELDHAGDARLLRALARAMVRYAPSVAVDAADGLILDITGCAHLFGGEAVMLREIDGRLAAAGMTPRSAIAGTADAAQAVARYGDGGVIVAGHEAKAVARFPVAALRLDEDAAQKLIHLGLKTVGDLSRRSRKPLAARFGAVLLDRLDRVCGTRDIPPSALRALPLCWAEQRFAEPMAQAASIAKALFDLAVLLAQQMEEQGIGGRSFDSRFFRADGLQRRIVVRTSTATREPKRICKLFAERLATLDDPLSSGFGFDLIRLTVRRHEPLRMAQDVLGGPGGETEKAAGIIDQLAARLGESHVLRLAPVDSHDPGRASRLVSVLQTSKARADWPNARDLPARPMTLFDPPQPIEDVVAGLPDGPPRQFRWRRRLNRIDSRDGAERISSEWWRALDETPPPAPVTEEEKQDLARQRAVAARLAQDRDYFQVEDSDGHRYWLYRQGEYGDPAEPVRWFLHGLLP